MEEVVKQPEAIAKASLRAKATGSGAERWINCSASVAMEYPFLEEEKKYASDGTLAHKIAAAALLDNTPIEDIQGPNIATIEAVQVYVGMVREIAGKGLLHVEERLNLLGSSGGIDCYAIRGRVAFLFDLKYGVGIRVTADENPQLAFYAVAIREKYPEVKTVQAYLIQPRIEGIFEDTASITSWTIPYQTLGMWRRNLDEALIEVEKASEIRAGSWCQFCKAKGICPAYVGYAEMVVGEMEAFSTEMIPAPGEKWLPEIIPRVARLRLMAEPIKAWFGKIDEFLLMVAKATPEGKKILLASGLEITKKRGRRRWKHEVDSDDIFDENVVTEQHTVDALIERGIADPFKRSLLPLTKVEELGVDVDDLVVKKEGGDKISPIEKGKDRKSLPVQTV